MKVEYYRILIALEFYEFLPGISQRYILINKKTLDNTLKIKDLISIHLKARAHMALLLIDKSQ